MQRQGVKSEDLRIDLKVRGRFRRQSEGRDLKLPDVVTHESPLVTDLVDDDIVIFVHLYTEIIFRAGSIWERIVKICLKIVPANDSDRVGSGGGGDMRKWGPWTTPSHRLPNQTPSSSFL
jgi:hypothetical protein